MVRQAGVRLAARASLGPTAPTVARGFLWTLLRARRSSLRRRRQRPCRPRRHP